MELQRMFRYLQPPVYRTLIANPHLPFARKRNLKVVFTIKTPLFEYKVPRKAAYGKGGQLASSYYTRRTDCNGKRYVTAPSQEVAQWTLFPCGGPEAHLPTFCGFYLIHGVVVDE